MTLWPSPIIGIVATIVAAVLLTNRPPRTSWTVIALGLIGVIAWATPWIMIGLDISPPFGDRLLVIAIAALMLYLGPAFLGLAIGAAIAMRRRPGHQPGA